MRQTMSKGLKQVRRWSYEYPEEKLPGFQVNPLLLFLFSCCPISPPFIKLFFCCSELLILMLHTFLFLLTVLLQLVTSTLFFFFFPGNYLYICKRRMEIIVSYLKGGCGGYFICLKHMVEWLTIACVIETSVLIITKIQI